MIPASWLAPFRFDGRIHRPLMAAFLAINLLVAINAVIHDPGIGYDADAHLDYLYTIGSGSLPSAQQSAEFYAAPLPYAIPGALGFAGVTGIPLAKAAQAANVLYCLILTYCLIRICRRAGLSQARDVTWALLLLGMLTVFYRSMALVRGEALCAALAVVVCDRVLAVDDQARRRAAHLVGLGVLAGLLLLAKQWGVFIAGALVVFLALRAWARSEPWRLSLASTGIVVLCAAVVGGWFYAYLSVRFGAAAAFTEPLSPLSFANRPLPFYMALPLDALFVAPVREQFSEPATLFWPLMYSDIWGDYWAYWLADWRDGELISPASLVLAGPPIPSHIGPYLGHLNMAGVLPAALYVCGAGLGAWAVAALMLRRQVSRGLEGLALCALMAGLPLAGYALLLVMVPTLDVKATYLLHVFPFAAVLAAACLRNLRRRVPRFALVLEVALGVIVVHNLPAFLSRFSPLSQIGGWF